MMMKIMTVSYTHLDVYKRQSLNNETNNINVAGGIFIHNKATMINDVKELLMGICRIYIDCEKGSLINQFNSDELIGDITSSTNKSEENNIIEDNIMEDNSKIKNISEKENDLLNNKNEIEFIEDEEFDLEDIDEETSFINDVEVINSELQESNKKMCRRDSFKGAFKKLFIYK